MKINNTNTTFGTGFWHIPQNQKRDLSHYKNLMPKTLGMLEEQNLVFFHNNNILLNSIANEEIIYEEREIVDLPTYSISLNFLEACKRQNNVLLHPREKGAIHYSREYKISGEDSFRKVFTVWTSKLFLLKNIALQNPFNTEYFAWSDISISRFTNIRTHWNFFEYEFSFDNSIEIFFYPSQMYYKGEILSCNASFMLFNRNSIINFVDRYERKMNHLINDSYAHDEETIIHEIYKDSPDLFGIIGRQ